ncbi:MAG: hypothetical protein QGG67_11735 [Gammaproteobacteria bacterium]|nr:hypothetical protein [Gammaproteobacteria bacterium]HJO12901.1 hypothetical protein [Gammaproteobacteria bacterium]
MSLKIHKVFLQAVLLVIIVASSATAAADDHGNDTSSATPIQPSSTTAGVLELQGDEDYFSLSIPSGGTLVVENAGSLSALGSLLDSAGNSVGFESGDAANSGRFVISHTVTAGTYFVRVRGWFDFFADSTSTGSYSLVSTFTADDHGNDIFSATPIQTTSTTAGEIEIKGDLDFFSLIIPESGTLVIETTGASETAAWLIDSFDNFLADTRDNGFNISRTVAAGTHYVGVVSSNFGQGSYSLLLTFTPGAEPIDDTNSDGGNTGSSAVFGSATNTLARSCMENRGYPDNGLPPGFSLSSALQSAGFLTIDAGSVVVLEALPDDCEDYANFLFAEDGAMTQIDFHYENVRVDGSELIYSLDLVSTSASILDQFPTDVREVRDVLADLSIATGANSVQLSLPDEYMTDGFANGLTVENVSGDIVSYTVNGNVLTFISETPGIQELLLRGVNRDGVAYIERFVLEGPAVDAPPDPGANQDCDFCGDFWWQHVKNTGRVEYFKFNSEGLVDLELTGTVTWTIDYRAETSPFLEEFIGRVCERTFDWTHFSEELTIKDTVRLCDGEGTDPFGQPETLVWSGILSSDANTFVIQSNPFIRSDGPLLPYTPFTP